ncbi:MAG: hypothetical protein ACXVXY_07170 [Mycobacteriaceae bacterium]
MNTNHEAPGASAGATWTDQPAIDTIAAELVACTLGQRSRPELRTDLLGRLNQFAARMTKAAELVGGSFGRFAAAARNATTTDAGTCSGDNERTEA